MSMSYAQRLSSDLFFRLRHHDCILQKYRVSRIEDTPDTTPSMTVTHINKRIVLMISGLGFGRLLSLNNKKYDRINAIALNPVTPYFKKEPNSVTLICNNMARNDWIFKGSVEIIRNVRNQETLILPSYLISS
jgi:hypothetical protein